MNMKGVDLVIGKVTTWQMTEEERLAYIAKHPIKPVDPPEGSTYANIYDFGKHRKGTFNPQPTVMDSIDKEKLRELFLSGMSIRMIAKEIHVSVSTLERYIQQQRQSEPDKWPYRLTRKG